MDPMSAMQLRLNELTERFAGGLPQRIATISRLLMRPDGELLSPAAAAEIERMLHSLAGTAGTFHFAMVASLAAEGEGVCERAASGLDLDDLDYLRSIVRDLQVAVAAECRT
jgi:chemotaxis protein histidine kinase CheA